MMRMAGLWIVTLLVATGCGGALNRKPGAMPQGGHFTGVWFSQQYGEMHIIQNGAAVQGRYFKDERKGTITGEAEGDLMEFEWVERKAMVANRPNEARGRGYFRYIIKKNGDYEEHRLEGEWGIDDNDTGGGPWSAYRMKNREPEVAPSSGGGGGGGASSDDYDDEGGGYEEEEEESGDEEDEDYL